MGSTIARHSLRLHGHEVCYRTAGERGPLVLLVHGITGSAAAWDPVTELLARDHRVLVPDLLGHGESAKPRGDYSLGAHAAGLRDLMIALGEERATVVGHSLGGGIAMQFAYQFAQRVERLALVSSGGLGREVGLLLRAAALPGAGPGAAVRRRAVAARRRRDRRARAREDRAARRLGPRRGWRRASPRSARARRAPRSSPPCSRSSTRAASASTPPTASTSPPRCRR